MMANWNVFLRIQKTGSTSVGELLERPPLDLTHAFAAHAEASADLGQGRHGQEDIGARAALHSAMERLIETNPVEAKLSLSTR